MPRPHPRLSPLLRFRSFPFAVLFVGAAVVDAAAQTTVEPPRVELAAVEVSASRVSASEVAGPQSIESYDATAIDDSGAFTLEEFFETLPPGADGDEQLVLIDGQPAYLDPSMLALGMIESIEVSVEGSMPEHGAYARGRVINIRLKKDYSGQNLSGRTRYVVAGGGNQHNAQVSGGEVHGKLRLMYSVEHSRSEPLWAVERPFSRQQDRRALGGSDLRLEWGYPAVFEALDGRLDVLSDALGRPVSAVLTPEGVSSTPAPTAFLPSDPERGAGAQGQRRFDTAPYRQLSSPSARTGGSVNFSYDFSPRLNLSLSASHRENSSDRLGPPPVTPSTADSIVPAAYSPWGEAVSVGLVHVGFGPTRERRQEANTDAGVRLGGRVAESWRWQAGYGVQQGRSTTVASDLDDVAFAAALGAADPAMRFNPFVDLTALGAASDPYAGLRVERERRQTSRNHRLDLSASGHAFSTPAGPVRTSVQGRVFRREWERRTTAAEDGRADELTRDERQSHALSGSVTVPFVARERTRPGLRRLEVEVSGQYEGDDDGGRERELEAGLVWSPARWLMLRVRHTVETENNVLSVDDRSESLTGETLIDPRRGFLSVSDVQVRVRDLLTVTPEESTGTHFGATVEPTALPGLRMSATYAERKRDPLFEDEFDAQDVVNNEAAFPGRVERAEPTAEDLASGRPGRILLVDTTGGDAGSAVSRDLNFSIDYRLPEMPLGRLHLKVDARHRLESRYELRPGVPFINEGGGRFNPPDWRIGGRVSWNRGGWTANLRGDHTGLVETNIVDDDVPAYTEFDLSVGYRWQQSLWAGFGRGLRLMASIDNLFDRDPPIADTLNGYRGGSALGRTISLAVHLPL